jgi:nucleoside-diphosphate-sugar epimerase
LRDLSMEGLLNEEIEGVETVFHLAGATIGAGYDEKTFFSANEAITVHLLQSCAGRVKRIVHASSQVVYGNINHLAITENFPIIGFDSAYACSKVNAENWLRWFYHKSGGVYIVLRLTGFIEGGGIVDYMIDKALGNDPIELFSKGIICRDYLHVDDGIDALVAALRIDSLGYWVCNIGSGQAITTLELANIVCTEIGSSSKIIPIATPADRTNFVFDISLSKTMLGFSPRSLVDEIRSYVRYRTERISNGN